MAPRSRRRAAGPWRSGATVATERIAAKIETDVEMRRRGVIDATKESIGQQSSAPIEGHLEAFENMLSAKGVTAKYAQCVMRNVRGFVDAGGIATPAGIDATRVETHVKSLRDDDVSSRTVNLHLISMKQFTRWLWRNNRLASDPLAGMKVDRKREAKDRRRVRRTLSDDELGHLVIAAEKGSAWTWTKRGADEPRTLSISGPDRAMLYRVATGTGLRAGELSQLNPSAFDLDSVPPTITAQAAYAKGGRKDTLPISRDLARILRPWLSGRPDGRPVFTLPPNDLTADMLRFDLKAAKIPATDAEGRVFDFHALRGQYITSLGRSGASQVVVQGLARHTDFNTTRRYLDITLADSAAAANDLPTPGVSTSVTPEPVVAEVRTTGTDGAENGHKFGQHSQTTSVPEGSQHVSMNAHGHDNNAQAQLSIDTTVSPDMSHNDTHAPPWTRTRNPLIKSQLLCQLS